MRLLFLVIFLGIPLIEIALFISVGERIGVAATILITLLTAAAGAVMLRIQGLGIVRDVSASLDRGEPPVLEVAEGMLIFAAGVCLLTPGFFTDAVGLLLFIPPLRGALAELFTAKAHVFYTDSGGGRGGSGAVIEGSYTVVDEEEDDAEGETGGETGRRLE